MISRINDALGQAGARDVSVMAHTAHGGFTAIPATEARQLLEKETHDLEAGLNGLSFTLQQPLACVAILCGGLTLLSGVGLVYQRRLAARGMQSRELLLEAFLRGRRLLPFHLVATIVVHCVGVTALLLYEAMVFLHYQEHITRDGRMIIAFTFILLALFVLHGGTRVVIVLVRALWRPMADEPLPILGRIVTRAQAARLWSFVGEVAERIHADMPDVIVAGMDRGFFVTEYPLCLRSGTEVLKGRVLYLPLPYMAFLDAPEAESVIGHELAHFTGGDTVYGQRFAPAYESSIGDLKALKGHKVVGRFIFARLTTILAEIFLDSFGRAERFWSRKRELAADAAGAGVAGTKALASALLRLTALRPLVAEVLAKQWGSAEAARAVMGDVLGELRQHASGSKRIGSQ
ncbi:MAG: M48 family metalloprotease [Alphaproteobacteria bacterium]|nr:M48 family metalloprotease [Alphaproteobacteria bacterium]